MLQILMPIKLIVCITWKDWNDIIESNFFLGHEDIDKVLPGTTKTIFEFLRDYKIPDGKPPNEFAFNGELKGKDFAIKVIEETYEQWRRLIQKEIPNKEGKVNIAT